MKMAGLALVIAALLVAQPQDENPPAASIHGSVINAITGEPLKNIPVEVLGAKASKTALTGPDGQFVAKDLEPGIVHLSVESHEFPGLLGIKFPVTLELKRGEDRTGVIVKLTPAGSISGTVRNDRNEPVPLCAVEAESAMTDPSAPGHRSSPPTQTNDKGEYRLEGLAEDRHFVKARCSESIPVQRPLSKDWDEPQESWLPVFYPDSPERSGAATVTVMPGSEASGIDFRLRRTPVGSVRGTIRRLPSARPTLLALDLIPKGSETEDDRLLSSQYIPSDANQFHLQYILPGLYTLWIASSDMDREPYFYASVDLDVQARHTRTVEVQMRPGIVVQGSVVSQAGSGDEEPSPTAKLSVFLTPARLRDLRSGQTAADGTFTITGLYPGVWTVSVGPSGGNWAVESVEWCGREMEGAKIVVSESQTGPLRIVAGSPQGGAVTGTLQNAAIVIGSDSDLAQRALRVLISRARRQNRPEPYTCLWLGKQREVPCRSFAAGRLFCFCDGRAHSCCACNRESAGALRGNLFRTGWRNANNHHSCSFE